ncbi:hypothetical protein NQZ79_g2732 [Umbelopsis isabellina]|nr:hypothetical protein NQZ79_g2732 [Umbelopsis isabellina]
MAEAVFAHMVKQKNLAPSFQLIDSAGTAAYHVGEKPDIQEVLQHVKNMMSQSTVVLARPIGMKLEFAQVLHIKPAGSKAEVKLFGEFDPKGEKIIRDPYYGGPEGFEHNFKQVTRASEGFLKHLGLL